MTTFPGSCSSKVGPGLRPRVRSRPSSPTWLERALEDYRVLLLDQRGTGRSTPVGALEGMSAQEQADYLKHFRADGIVRDAEFIRAELGIERWSVLGQSFGGFCVTRYLSASPDGLAEAFLTGGLPPLEAHPDDIYRRRTAACSTGTARTTSAIPKIASASATSSGASMRRK